MAAVEQKSELMSNLCDYRLIDNIDEHKTYKCSNTRCNHIVESGEMLDCDISSHDERLYCSICVTVFKQQQLCPVDGHPNPVFKDAQQVIKYLKIPKLRVICPNSVQYKHRKLNKHHEDAKDHDGEGDVVERDIMITDHPFIPDKHKEQHCLWVGEYRNLKDHVELCQYQPTQCEYNGCDYNNDLSVHSYQQHKQRFLVKHLDIVHEQIRLLPSTEVTAPLLQLENRMNDIINEINDKVRTNASDIDKLNDRVKNNTSDIKRMKDVEPMGIKSVYVIIGILVLILSYLLYDKYASGNDDGLISKQPYSQDIIDMYAIRINNLNETQRENVVLLEELQQKVDNDTKYAHMHIYNTVMDELNKTQTASDTNSLEIIHLTDDIKSKNDRIDEQQKTIQHLMKQIESIKQIPKDSTRKQMMLDINGNFDDDTTDNDKTNKYVELTVEWVKWIVYYGVKIVIFCGIWFPTLVIADDDSDKEMIVATISYLFGHLVLLWYYYSFVYWKIYMFVVILQFAIAVLSGKYLSRIAEERWLWFCAVLNFIVWAYFYHDGPLYALYIIFYGYWFPHPDYVNFNKQQFIWECAKHIFYYAVKIVIFCGIWWPTIGVCECIKRGDLRWIFACLLYLIGHLILLCYYFWFEYWKVYLVFMVVQFIITSMIGKYLDSAHEKWLWFCAFLNFTVWAYFYVDGPFYALYMICYGYWFSG